MNVMWKGILNFFWIRLYKLSKVDLKFFWIFCTTSWNSIDIIMLISVIDFRSSITWIVFLFVRKPNTAVVYLNAFSIIGIIEYITILWCTFYVCSIFVRITKALIVPFCHFFPKFPIQWGFWCRNRTKRETDTIL